MTKEQFWATFDMHWHNDDMEKLWDLVNSNRHYMNEFIEEVDRGLADPNSEIRKEADAWWAKLRPQVAEAFGEDWIKENCTEFGWANLP